MEIHKVSRLGKHLNMIALMLSSMALGAIISGNKTFGLILLMPTLLIVIFGFFFIDLRIIKRKNNGK